MSAGQGQRSRSTTDPSRQRARFDPSLKSLLVPLSHVRNYTFDPNGQSHEDYLVQRTQDLQNLRAYLQKSAARRDIFRLEEGFEALEDLLRFFQSSWKASDQISINKPVLLAFLYGIFETLSEILWDNPANRSCFSERGAQGGGWILVRAVTSDVIPRKPFKLTHSDFSAFRQLIAMSFSSAFRHDDLYEYFSALPMPQDDEMSDSTSSHGYDDNSPESNEEEQLRSMNLEIQHDLRKLRTHLQILWMPQMMLVVFDVCERVIPFFGIAKEWQKLGLSSLNALLGAVTSSESNAVGVHETDILVKIMSVQILRETDGVISAILAEICHELMRFGFRHKEDAIWLFQEAKSNITASNLLLELVKRSRDPSRFHFDMSLLGYASVEFKALAGNFPPLGSNSGYTFMAYVNFLQFDSDCHTTLFGAFDPSQICFLLIYMERDTHQLVLQTSVFSERPSVRFKTFSFLPKVWYHIAIVHRHSRSDGPSRAALFVDGDFVEQVKCNYPSSPPRIKPTHQDHVGTNSTRREQSVQAFFGTPNDLASQPEKGKSISKWNLAHAHLVSEVLPDELIFVYKNLGPNYCGNYQDCLGSFQTYGASAALNVRNELLHPAGLEGSLISAALRSKAGRLNNEQNFLLSISTATIIGDGFSEIQDLSQSNSLSNSKSKTLVINTSVIKLKTALDKSYGFGTLMGGVIVCKPSRFEDTLATVSGCLGPCLDLLNSAGSFDRFESALKLTFELVRDSWRNSESFERENGFAILAWLLKRRLEAIESSSTNTNEMASNRETKSDSSATFKVLQIILNYIGYDAESPERSIIVNPLAYRALLVDADVWRSADVATQVLYYTQFVVFGHRSEHASYNVKRLTRMRIVRRMLDTLRAEEINVSVLPIMLEAFRTILANSMSSDVHRSLALFTTYAVSNSHVHRTRRPRNHSTSDDSERKPQNQADYIKPSITSTTIEASTLSSSFSCAEVGYCLLEEYATLVCDDTSMNHIKKFAKTVTNKYLLYLLSSDSPRVVVTAMKILAKVLIGHGPAYVSKFDKTTKGFTIILERLRPWWHVQNVWIVLFAIFFGIDVAQIDFNQSRILGNITSIFCTRDQLKVYCPAVLCVLVGLLQEGVRCCTSRKDSSRRRPVSPGIEVNSSEPHDTGAEILISVTDFLKAAIDRYQDLSGFFQESNSLRELLRIPFTTKVTSNMDKYDSEQPMLPNIHQSSSSIDKRKLDAESKSSKSMAISEAHDLSVRPSLNKTRDRSSSFVVISTSKPHSGHLASQLLLPLAARTRVNEMLELEDPVIANILQILVTLSIHQVIAKTEFTGLGLFLKAPACDDGVRSFVNSYVLRQILVQLQAEIEQNNPCFLEPRVLTNLSRFIGQASEAYCEGWFSDDGNTLLSCLGAVLAFLNREDNRHIKVVRLCSPTIANLTTEFQKLAVTWLVRQQEVAWRLADRQRPHTGTPHLESYHEVLFSPQDTDVSPPSLILSLLIRMLFQAEGFLTEGFSTLASLMRCFQSTHPAEFSSLILYAVRSQPNFAIFLEEQILKEQMEWTQWIGKYQAELGNFRDTRILTFIDKFIEHSNTASLESAQLRLHRRSDRLEALHLEELTEAHAWTEHHASTANWFENINSSETLKLFRARQDIQENFHYLGSLFEKQMLHTKELHHAKGTLDRVTWQLDESEGRDRVRLRLYPIRAIDESKYRPKRANSIQDGVSNSDNSDGMDFLVLGNAYDPEKADESSSLIERSSMNPKMVETMSPIKEEFEIVISGANAIGEEEDKNRKVMRSLQRGEEVQNVHNASIIVGLEACAALLIIGKEALYMLDDLFQRSDGEIVTITQAPENERDPYAWTISGRRVDPENNLKSSVRSTVNHWPWKEIVSFSKRRFLLRDVALELFFRDGRSYLLTFPLLQKRDDFHADLITRCYNPRLPMNNQMDSAWRAELLPNPAEDSRSFGSRISSVFSPVATNKVTRQWMKGEVSNFHYLMMINTLAGRTFNDLTQYPVFPWVLADYSSDTLDLNNPRSFRDLSKPMGCQTFERESTFRERFSSFADMTDESTPPFHYGTHYSSAMIVASFLIRLQPFVKSYLLMQGGNFDHADRLFYSIERAWASASKETFSDVRELIPEFFYLPDFLSNLNHYDFGRRGNSELVSDVELPPWAKGSPAVFVAKHREALESPYVSQNLHHWIDLIFGFKQKGQAALEATNVFHHLSYRGAKDLDMIQDERERIATIGIIHNFGQTPHQVFSRPHERREDDGSRTTRLFKHLNSLTRTHAPVCDLNVPIQSLHFSIRDQRCMAAIANSTLLPPNFDVVLEWGFVDSSTRFFKTSNHKDECVLEQLHREKILVAQFADSKTLITAGEEGVISVWVVTSGNGSWDLEPKADLHGHRASVMTLAISRVFGTLLSGSKDGHIILWDLNRLESVRAIQSSQRLKLATINDMNGHILIVHDQDAVLYTLNGEKLLEENVSEDASDSVTSCAFYATSSNAWIDTEVIFTGHLQGRIKIWKTVILSDGAWSLQLIRTLHPWSSHTGDIRGSLAITSLLSQDRRLFAGDGLGRVFEYDSAP